MAAGLAGLAGCGAYGSLFEPFNYEVTERDVFVRGLGEGFEGFRVAQVTDVHHSRIVPIGEVRRVVELANGAKADCGGVDGRLYDCAAGLYRAVCGGFGGA